MNRKFTKTLLGILLIFLAAATVLAQESQIDETIKIEISREINGETETFKGAYENEEQMKNDPALKEFTGGGDPFLFQFNHTNDSNHMIDIQKLGGANGTSFRLNNSFQFNMDSMMAINDDSLEKLEEHLKELEKHLGNMDFNFGWTDSLSQALHHNMRLHHFGSSAEQKKVEIMIVEGNETGKKGQVKKSEALELETLSYYPNPSQGQFNLRFKVPGQDKLSVKIFNLDGKTIYSRYFDQFGGTYSEHIDLSDQKEGLYILEIKYGKKRLARKVVVE